MNDAHLELLRARARRLADRGQDGAMPTETTRVMGVRVGDSHYALSLAQVAEVHPLRDLSPVPGAPAGFLGLVNLRNELRAVVDLATILGVPAGGGAGGPEGFLVYPRPGICGARQVALRVDFLGEVFDLNHAELSPPGADNKAGERPVRRGVAPGGFCFLDLSYLFGINAGDPR